MPIRKKKNSGPGLSLTAAGSFPSFRAGPRDDTSHYINVDRVQVAGRVFPRSWAERQAGAEHVARRTTALAGRIVAQQRAVKVEPWKAGGPGQQARGRSHLHGTGQER